MKRAMILLMVLLLLSPLACLQAGAAAPRELASNTAVLLDYDTGQVLYSKDMDKRIYPASTTKVLTALVVLENSRPYEVVTVGESAVDSITYDSSHIALTEGEQFTVESGLYALMLPSANDAANALAEHVAGSQEAFARLMNEKAEEIGAYNSHFTNAHGLHDENHYSTAYDIALITRYAMQNEQFMDYFGAPRYTMPETNLNEERPFTNYQYMLVRETGYFDPRVLGGKVGFTSQALHTMTTAAQKNGRTLVCAVMGSPNRGDKFADTELLLDYGFEEFSAIVVNKDRFAGFQAPVLRDGVAVGSAAFAPEGDFAALLHQSVRPEDVQIRYARPESYQADGPIACTVYFELADPPANVPALVGTMALKADVRLSPPALGLHQPEAEAEAWSPGALEIAAMALGGLLLLFVVFVLYRRHKIRQRRLARQRRLEQKRREAERAARRPPPSRTAHPRRVGYGAQMQRRAE